MGRCVFFHCGCGKAVLGAWARTVVTQVLGIDRAVAWINVTSAWALVRGPFSAFFIVTFLSVEQQGLWYAFSNLAALSVFAELGFSMIVSQFVSHEYSRLAFARGRLTGERHDLDRLVSLVRYAVRVYAVVVLTAIAILSIVGFFYFRRQPYVVLAAWVFFSVTSGASLFVSLLQSIYRGMDKVADTQKAALASAMVGALCTWLALYLGFTVWALPIGSAAGALVLLWLVIRLAPGFWFQLYRHRLTQESCWTRELIWLQGRYALTWASSYFIFNLLVPAAFKIKGAVVAGQLGLTLAVVAAMRGFATATVSANVPRLNMLIATARHNESYLLIRKATIVSCVLYVIGAICLVAGLAAIEGAGLYKGRFLSPPLLILVLAYQLPPTLTSGASAFLRAHKAEPHLALAIVQGILIAMAVFAILPRFDLTWLLIVFNLIFWLIAVPWIFLMVAGYRRRHDQALGAAAATISWGDG